MKKLLFFMSFFLFVGLSAQAQSCLKTCTKAKTTTTDASKKASDTKVAAAYMEADKIASTDENIEKRECAVSGTVSYFEKSKCPVSGKVTWEEVEFDSEAKKFTKVASASMEKDPSTGEIKAKQECTPEEKAKCAAKCAAKAKTKASKA
jgi:hypothetical protein